MSAKKNISDVVANIIEKDNNLRIYMQEGLINYTAFAKKYHKFIQEELSSQVNLSAISMAARRYIENCQRILQHKVDFDIVIVNNIIDYNFKISPKVIDEIFSLFQSFQDKELSLSLYRDSLAIIASSNISCIIEEKKLLMSNLVLKLDNLACFHLLFKGDFLNTPGIICNILKLLEGKGVNVLEVLSTSSKLQLVIKEAQLDVTYKLLNDYLTNKVEA